MEKAIIGVDIGGTNLKIAIVRENDLLSTTGYYTEKTARGPENLLQQLEDCIHDLIDKHQKRFDLQGIGVATAGRVDFRRGKIIFANQNLPGWSGQNLREILEKKFSIPVVVENDVNAAAWAEYIIRDLQQKTLICLTLGTGLGAGIIIKGQLIRGRNGRAGELGYMVIDEGGKELNANHRGCWEMYVSKKGIKITAEKYYSQEVLRATTVKDIFARARSGEEEAQQIVEETARYLTTGLKNLVYAIDPDYIVLGGGIARAGEQLLEPTTKYFYDRDIKEGQPALELARLDNRAGIIGAANLAFGCL